MMGSRWGGMGGYGSSKAAQPFHVSVGNPVKLEALLCTNPELVNELLWQQHQRPGPLPCGGT